MSVNLNKPQRWNADIERSVDLFNAWFMNFAPRAYRDTRVETTVNVEKALADSDDLTGLSWTLLRSHPSILPTLRMTTCPPLARDRLVGLAGVSKNLVGVMEDGQLPSRMTASELQTNLERIVVILKQMVDVDIFPWLTNSSRPDDQARRRAATIVADRLCGAVSDPIIRNAQERRQLGVIADYLGKKGYVQKQHPSGTPIDKMAAGTYCFRCNVKTSVQGHDVNIPIDTIVQPKTISANGLPLLIEAKSAGDFTNVNKRRKEEATKMRQLQETFGKDVRFILFLCGYFDKGYLSYEAAEGIDWIWEHRLSDMDELGL